MYIQCKLQKMITSTFSTKNKEFIEKKHVYVKNSMYPIPN